LEDCAAARRLLLDLSLSLSLLLLLRLLAISFFASVNQKQNAFQLEILSGLGTTSVT
jgi:hypothetical protein